MPAKNRKTSKKTPLTRGRKNAVWLTSALATRIRARMRERGISQLHVTTYLGVSESWLSTALSSRNGVSQDRFDALMLYLDLCE
jgi:hypothetical protein